MKYEREVRCPEQELSGVGTPEEKDAEAMNKLRDDRWSQSSGHKSGEEIRIKRKT